jgi:zinc protease
MKTIKHSVFVVLFALTVVSSAFAAEPLGKRIVLNNGMVLLLAEQHTVPMVTVHVTVKAGDISAPADEPGIAGLTASLLTQGTASRTAKKIHEEIDFIGGSLSSAGGDDAAAADLRVLKKDLRIGLDLLSDVLMHPAFAQTEIDRLVRETLAGIKHRKEEPASVASQAFEKAVYGSHPYGIVDDDVAAYLPKVAQLDIRKFYASRYVPANTVIAVAGDVTQQEIVSLLNEYFKDWAATGRQEKTELPAPVTPAGRVVKIDMPTQQASIFMGHLGVARENHDYYKIVLMNYILGGGGFTSHLMDVIRDNKGLAYDVHSVFAAQKESGSFQVAIQTKNESANEVIEETIRQIKKMQTDLVSEKELADAKAYLTGSFPLRLDTSGKIAGMLSSIEMFRLGLDYPAKFPSLINAVTREDIRRAAQLYLNPDAMVIVVVADQEKAGVKEKQK